MGKLGNTPFEIAGYLSEDASGIRLNLSANWFLPASAVADWRRQVIRSRYYPDTHVAGDISDISENERRLGYDPY